MRLSTIGCFTVLGCFICGQAQAIPTYTYVTDATSYTGQVGSTVSVNLYLLESTPATGAGDISTDGGLATAGAGVNAVGGTGTSTIAQSGAFSANTLYFGQPSVGASLNYDQGGGSNLEFNLLTGTSGPYPKPDASGKILLGSVAITVGSGLTTYNLTSLFDDTINGGNSLEGQSNGNTSTLTGDDLDGAFNSTTTLAIPINGANAAAPYVFTVGSATPEPTSFALIGLAGMGLLTRRRRNA